VPIAIAIAGIALKIYLWYYSRPLWLDEEMVFLNIRDRTLFELAAPLWLDQSAPLGWLTVQRIVLDLFGSGDRAVRALSVLFGIGTVIVATWTGIRWMTVAGASLLVLLCSFGMWMTHYSLEAKPYAGDAFWALLLPALVMWTTEGETGGRSVALRRSMVWWLVATLGVWMSYGAIFAAPACAVVLCLAAWRYDGPRRAVIVAFQGLLWLAAFGAHYYLVLRHARASDFLVDYWSSGLPPAGASAASAVSWVVRQAQPIASHPGGTGLWLSFWLAAACGVVLSFRQRPLLASAMFAVIVSAGIFAAVGLVPFQDRLALWIVPAVYVAIALGADASIHFIRQAFVRRAVIPAAIAVATAVLVWPLSADILKSGRSSLTLRAVDNHALNDRAAARFLTIQHQPGDALVANHFGLPALWWYGGISIGDPYAGSRYTDGGPIFELTHEWPGRSCRRIQGQTQPQRALAGVRRAAIYLGFGSRIPPGLQELALNAFSEFSQVVSFKLVSNEGVVAIFDLQAPPEPGAVATRPTWRGDVPARLHGCVNVRPARRW
jgi:hypothetical protein